MSLTGTYADRAVQSYKTVEGRELLAAVRHYLKTMDTVMNNPSSFNRGQMIGKLTTELEIAADRYDLFGEKDRRRRKQAT